MDNHDICHKMANEIINLLTKKFLFRGVNIVGLGGQTELTNYLLQNSHRLIGKNNNEYENKPKPFKGWGV